MASLILLYLLAGTSLTICVQHSEGKLKVGEILGLTAFWPYHVYKAVWGA